MTDDETRALHMRACVYYSCGENEVCHCTLWFCVNLSKRRKREAGVWMQALDRPLSTYVYTTFTPRHVPLLIKSRTRTYPFLFLHLSPVPKSRLVFFSLRAR
jgi:hypothetical protein